MEGSSSILYPGSRELTFHLDHLCYDLGISDSLNYEVHRIDFFTVSFLLLDDQAFHSLKKFLAVAPALAS